MTHSQILNRRTLKVLAGAGLLVFALALSLAAAGPAADDGAPARDPEPRLVETGGVTPATAVTTVSFAGSVRAVRRGALSFTVGGRLAARPVTAGQRVAAGAVLARLDRRQLRHAADAAEAASAVAAARAAQARRDLERVERLAAARAATAEELEQARAAAEVAAAAVASAAARLEEARRRLGEGVLTAPWAGTVTEVMLEPGEYAEAGAPVLHLSGDGALEVEVELPESLVGAVTAGQEVVVERVFGGAPVVGRVSSVGRAAAGAGRLYPLLVALPEVGGQPGGGLAPGATVEVHLRRAPRGELTVPLEAVLNPGGSGAAVFAVRDGRAVRVPVRVGSLEGTRVTVAPGGDGAALGPDDRVVVAGHTGLIDGDPVRPQEVAR